MRRCEDCRIILDDDVRFCPKCGKDLTVSAPAALRVDTDVAPLIASANLHKIRAEWDEAIDDATSALRLAPRDPDIASLLGGIYEERGMSEEAVIWYQMALELNPNNTQDQERLDRVTRSVSAKRRGTTESFRVFEKRTKVWGWALGAVFVAIVAMAIITTLAGRRHAERPTPSSSMRTAQPIVTPPLGRPGVTLPQRPIPGTEPGRPTETGPPTSVPPPPTRTAAESDVERGLASTPAITDTGAAVGDVMTDPRAAVATVTFTVATKDFVSKDQILRAAVAVARRTFQLHQGLKWVTLRCLIQTGTSAPQIAFTADIARQNALPNIPDDVVAASCMRPWWHPELGNR